MKKKKITILRTLTKFTFSTRGQHNHSKERKPGGKCSLTALPVRHRDIKHAPLCRHSPPPAPPANIESFLQVFLPNFCHPSKTSAALTKKNPPVSPTPSPELLRNTSLSYTPCAPRPCKKHPTNTNLFKKPQSPVEPYLALESSVLLSPQALALSVSPCGSAPAAGAQGSS